MKQPPKTKKVSVLVKIEPKSYINLLNSEAASLCSQYAKTNLNRAGACVPTVSCSSRNLRVKESINCGMLKPSNSVSLLMTLNNLDNSCHLFVSSTD